MLKWELPWWVKETRKTRGEVLLKLHILSGKRITEQVWRTPIGTCIYTHTRRNFSQAFSVWGFWRQGIALLRRLLWNCWAHKLMPSSCLCPCLLCLGRVWCWRGSEHRVPCRRCYSWRSPGMQRLWAVLFLPWEVYRSTAGQSPEYQTLRQ